MGTSASSGAVVEGILVARLPDPSLKEFLILWRAATGKTGPEHVEPQSCHDAGGSGHANAAPDH